MSAGTVTALVAAGVALIGTVLNYLKLKGDQRNWEREKRLEPFARIREERLTTYAPVFEILGHVRDVPDPDKRHWQNLENNRPDVEAAADKLLEHLYGEAGLVMSYKTRNAILAAYVVSVRFAGSRVSLESLIEAYYLARRSLRVDLEILDPGYEEEGDINRIERLLEVARSG